MTIENIIELLSLVVAIFFGIRNKPRNSDAKKGNTRATVSDREQKESANTEVIIHIYVLFVLLIPTRGYKEEKDNT